MGTSPIPCTHLIRDMGFWPTTRSTGIVGADLAVLGVSILLFLGALVVFGHLEGNFAEEL